MPRRFLPIFVGLWIAAGGSGCEAKRSSPGAPADPPTKASRPAEAPGVKPHFVDCSKVGPGMPCTPAVPPLPALPR